MTTPNAEIDPDQSDFKEFAFGITIVEVMCRIADFVDVHDLGDLASGEVGVKFPGHDVIGIDITFVSNTQMTSSFVDAEGWLAVAPELIVEVTWRRDTMTELIQKVQLCFQHGTKEAWIIFTDQQVAAIYRPDGSNVLFTEDSTLSGSVVLPGFEMPITDIFADLNALRPKKS
jgi:hypothetical protein